MPIPAPAFDFMPLQPFLYDALLQSRQKIGKGPFANNEDDVVMYLVQLLVHAADPDFFSRDHHPPLFSCPTDLHLHFDTHQELTEIGRAQIYAFNANARLILLVIFRQDSLFRPHASWFPPQTHLEHAQIFYQFAGDLFFRRRRQSASSDALAQVHQKLAQAFHWYVKLLGHLRVDYLHLLEQLSRGSMFHLEHRLEQQHQAQQNQQAMDAYLDAILEHRRSQNEETQRHLRAAKDAANQRGLFY